MGKDDNSTILLLAGIYFLAPLIRTVTNTINSALNCISNPIQCAANTGQALGDAASAAVEEIEETATNYGENIVNNVTNCACVGGAFCAFGIGTVCPEDIPNIPCTDSRADVATRVDLDFWGQRIRGHVCFDSGLERPADVSSDMLLVSCNDPIANFTSADGRCWWGGCPIDDTLLSVPCDSGFGRVVVTCPNGECWGRL